MTYIQYLKHLKEDLKAKHNLQSTNSITRLSSSVNS